MWSEGTASDQELTGHLVGEPIKTLTSKSRIRRETGTNLLLSFSAIVPAVVSPDGSHEVFV